MRRTKARKEIPPFGGEQEEFDFWSVHDSTDYFESTQQVEEKLQFTRRRPPKKRVTMLLDPRLKSKLQKIASEKGIPYQTLIQIWLRERVNEEIKRKLA